MSPVATVTLEEGSVVKRWRLDHPLGPGFRDAAQWAYARLEGAGVAPALLEVGEDFVRMERGEPLEDRLRGNPEVDRPWGRMVVGAVRRMHERGVAHRDLHVRNLVLVGGEVRLVDFAFATEADPSRPPFDLFGPAASGVAVHPEHVERGLEVWWGCATARLALRTWFGPVGGCQ